MDETKNKPEEFWREKLTPQQYKILRERGTEAPFSGEYLNNHDHGDYACAACGEILFSSNNKFNSGSGWPAFSDVIDTGKVSL